MDASYISPLISATKNVFDTMLKVQVKFGQPTLTEAIPSKFDVSGIIGLSGDIVGAVVLSFPTSTAEKIVSAFAGMPITADSDVFADAIGELANMVAGGGKTRYEGKNVSISCPSVVIGPGHRVAAISDSTCVVVPCYTEHGEFAIELSIRNTFITGADGKQTKTSTAASSTA